MSTLSVRVEGEFAALGAGWTDFRPDLIGGLKVRRGLRGDGPNERVGGPGSLTLVCNNSPTNSLGLTGAYSPDHVNLRSGFRVGMRVRVVAVRSGIVVTSSSVANPSVITTAAPHYLVTGETVTITGHSGSTPSINASHVVTVLSATTFSIPVNVTVGGTVGTLSVEYVQIVTRIRKITPAPGRGGTGGVSVVAMDWMQAASKVKTTGLEIRDTVRGDELLEDVIALVPTEPVGTDFDEGLDTYAFAFDSVGSTVLAEIARIVKSGYDLFYELRTGVLRYENRHHRLTANLDPDITLDGDMVEMTPEHDLDRVISQVTGVAHPRDVDEDFSVLYTHDDKPFFSPGETRTIKGKFTDSSNKGTKVGAFDVQEPEPGVDFTADTVQATAAGSADTPFTLRPTAAGHYTGFSGSVASVADGVDGTVMTPPAGLVYQSFVHGGLAAPDNAAVSGLTLNARVKHNSGGNYANWYPRIRTASVDLDGQIQSTGEGAPATTYPFSVAFPSPPTGGEWTVGLVNNTELAAAFNWNAGTPDLDDIWFTGFFASSVLPTDRTDDFEIVDFRPAGADFEVDVKSNSVDGAYLTKLEIRGRRITTYQPSEKVAKDDTSIAAYGQTELTYDAPYQGDEDLVEAIAQYVLSAYKDPRTFLPSVTFWGFRSEEHLVAALRLDVSHLVRVIESVTGIERNYFINGVEIDMTGNVVVKARWLLAPADENDYFVLDEDSLDGPAILAPF